MLSISNLSQICAVFAGLLASWLIAEGNPSFHNHDFLVAVETSNFATLADGKYQFCSQPDPKDWRDGAGVCLIFSKAGKYFDGYYGYPHSDSFVCLRGNVDGNLIKGQALAILWNDKPSKDALESAFKWDLEGRLTLSEGKIIRTVNDGEVAAQWILYRNALLNIARFYQYNRPRMTPPSQLCEWSLN